MPKPLVTIALPTVDRINYVPEALESAAAQTYPNIEILVGDNSADADYHQALLAAAEDIRARYPAATIRIERREERLPMVAHMNALVQEATGDLWLYLPDDDCLLPECVETLAACLDTYPKASLAFSNHWIVDPTRMRDEARSAAHTIGTHRGDLHEGLISHEQLRKLALWNGVGLPGTLHRRANILRFPLPESSCPDVDLICRIADSEEDLRAVHSSARLYEYRGHPGNFSAWTPSLHLSVIRTVARCSNLRDAEPKMFRRTLSTSYAALGKTYLDAGDKKQALRAIRKAISLDPASALSYRFLLQVFVPERARRR